MSRIIEPAGVQPPDGDPGGAGEKPDRLDPSIMPTVAEHARTSIPTSITVAFVAITLVVAAALLFVFWRLLTRPLRVESPKASPPAVASAAGVKGFESLPPPPDAGRRAPREEHRPLASGIDASKDDPIGLRGTESDAGTASPGASAAGQARGTARGPEDAPVLLTRPHAKGLGARAMPGDAGGESTAGDSLVDARASLAEYRRQLGKSLESLQATIPGTAGQAGPRPATAVATGAPAAGAGAFPQVPPGGGGSRGVLGMQASDAPPARAGVLGNRSLVLPQGTSLTCALTTRVVSAQAGFIGCQVLRNVYGVDGRVLLIERGSHLDGEYRVAQAKPGTTRIPALWTRLRTPGGVTIDLDSPATGPLGESGADATVDNRWFERVGAAMLVSVLDDSLKIVLNNETAPQQGNAVVFQGTAQTASQMAGKVLDATISLPPLLYADQGGLVGVYVSRDVDFSSVYELQPVAQGR